MGPESDLQLRSYCFDKDGNRLAFHGCETAELVEKNGIKVQVGGPPVAPWDVCKQSHSMFATPYEVGFAIDFTTIDNIPRGCGPLDGAWIKEYAKPDCKPYCDDSIARLVFGILYRIHVL